MSKMDRTQFAKACGALASAWKGISKKGLVYGISKMTSDKKVELQMDWEDLRELFPGSQTFVERASVEYRWEARIDVEGVVVFALLTDAQKDEAQDKEAE